MNRALRHLVVPAFLLACLVAGGASAAGYWSNLVLQLAALPLIVAAVASRRAAPLPPEARQAILLLGGVVALILLQLVPLPPAIWTHLPGRGPVAAGFSLLGLPLPWLPISLEPYRTIASALWLLPAVAVFFGIAVLGLYRGTWIAWGLAATSLVSIGLGALQRVGGEQSALYLYRITNIGVMTGFFANANHLATLLLATIPFLAALHLSALQKGRSVKKASGLLVVLAGTAVIIVVGLVGSESIAGMGLAGPVSLASIILVLSRKRRISRWSVVLILALTVACVAGAFSAPFNNNLTGKSAYTSEDSRLRSFSTTTQAAGEFLPLGSGIGTFQQVYREHEDPAAVGRFYMNHAHGDYLEVALETGVPGLLLIAAFVLWWLQRSASLWRDPEADPFAKAATIAIAAILAHSIVDYPLRTAAISAVFAACCALLANSRAKVAAVRPTSGRPPARHLSAD